MLPRPQQSYTCYGSFFINFAIPNVLTSTSSAWPGPFSVITTALVALINQAFQSWRISVLTNSNILGGTLLVAALAACGIALATAIQTSLLSESSLAEVAALQPTIEASLALHCSTIAHLTPREVIFIVKFSKSKISGIRTDKVLNRLIRTMIQSGFFTAYTKCVQTMMEHLIRSEQLRNILAHGANPSLSQFSLGRSKTPVAR
ncbi:hypothetical protein B0H17DRAFT_1200420 [Mycena rosella]|uniref:Uncharacterized protein n=1 Tax=Mycena rosella TaxID=1033263 RepID=A0AAD7DKY4_MYCRO|nr:hypothetical protein B0H17DRAFT_1200420 [Mycena rosella]